jgi:hypothetical protein
MAGYIVTLQEHEFELFQALQQIDSQPKQEAIIEALLYTLENMAAPQPLSKSIKWLQVGVKIDRPFRPVSLELGAPLASDITL